MLLVGSLAAGCASRPPAVASPAPLAVGLPSARTGPLDPQDSRLPPGAREGERNRCVDRELERRGLNDFGDPQGTEYASGLPLGVSRHSDRFEHVMRRHPDIGAACARAPMEQEP